MRTKRILSVLLTILLAAGMFGMTSVFADEAEPVVQVAAKGWAAVTSPLKVEEDKTATNSMAEAVVTWEKFAASADDVKDSYADLEKESKITVDWKAWRVIAGVDTPLKVQANWGAASTTSGCYVDPTTTHLRLWVKQPTTGDPWYGVVKVELTVTVDGSAKTGTTSVELTKPTALTDLVEEAEEAIANASRYQEAYIKNLKAVTATAKTLLGTNATQTQVDAYVALMKLALEGKDGNGVEVCPDGIYKLTGWAWLDGVLGQGFISFIWKAVDVFSTLSEFFGRVSEAFAPLVTFFGQIGSALGYIMPLFSLLGSLIGL